MATLPTIALVSCVKLKQSVPAPAREMYVSPLFRGMRRYAERVADRWFILSAKYGLLDPDEVIEPYEQTLRTASARERESWAKGVARNLVQRVSPPTRIVMLAGVNYRFHLMPQLDQAGFEVEIPLQGLRMGQQLSWLNVSVRPSHLSRILMDLQSRA